MAGVGAQFGAVRLLLTCDGPTARALTDACLREQGWRGKRRADGAVVYERGSLRRTLLLGALAGKRFHVRLVVHALSVKNRAAGAGSVVELRVGEHVGWALGGMLGIQHARVAADEAVADLEREFSQRGVLAGAR